MMFSKSVTDKIGRTICAVVSLASIGIFGQACSDISPNQQIIDLEITTEVKAGLVSDVRGSSLTNISVNTTNGIVVTLFGQVENAG